MNRVNNSNPEEILGEGNEAGEMSAGGRRYSSTIKAGLGSQQDLGGTEK